MIMELDIHIHEDSTHDKIYLNNIYYEIHMKSQDLY